MFMFHELNAGQNCNRKTDDKSFKSVAQFKYLGTTQTQQTCMHVQIKSRLNTREDMWENNIKMDVEIKCQLDATEVFIADLIACSTCFGHHYAHHQELKSIIQWLLPVVFCAVKM